MKQYNKTIEKYDGTLAELANDLGDLHYEELMKFLASLSYKFFTDSKKDSLNNKPKLAKTLMNAFNNTDSTRYDIETAWKISKPYMEEESENEYTKDDLLEDLKSAIDNFEFDLTSIKESTKKVINENPILKNIFDKINKNNK